jgi:hypothetical protein
MNEIFYQFATIGLLFVKLQVVKYGGVYEKLIL